MFASGGSGERVVSHPPKVNVAKDLTGFTQSARSGSKPPSLSRSKLWQYGAVHLSLQARNVPQCQRRIQGQQQL
eukprot:11294591-Karenia_brevis.AAC.1